MGKGPMFGDLEAQRHWMEITTNLAVSDWYRNGTDNNLLYWGLDYPPLTAFHEYILGKIAQYVYPEMVIFKESQGLESVKCILFIRLSVILMDCVLYLPACFLYVYRKKYLSWSRLVLFLLLFSPGLLLIDHGHFQYNSVCLGLVILSILCICNDYDCLGSFFFVMAIGYKQIALYYSLVFFIWLLRKCYNQRSVTHLIQIGCTVIVSFLLLFLPFCVHLPDSLSVTESLRSVIQRMFPWDRWVFEDKVASVWCTLNNVIKLNVLFSPEKMKALCLISTLIGCIPTLLLLWKSISFDSVLSSLFLCSLSFFLFSYHVHEKTILFPLLPMILLGGSNINDSIWFSFMASYSMIPLYIKDDNFLIGVVFTLAFIIVLTPKKPMEITAIRWMDWLITMCVLLAVAASILYYAFPPPARYPDLHSVLISSISCGYFVLEYVAVLRRQWCSCRKERT